MCIYLLQPGHLEDEENDRKEKRSKIKKKEDNPKYKGLLPVKIITCSWQKAQARRKMVKLFDYERSLLPDSNNKKYATQCTTGAH